MDGYIKRGEIYLADLNPTIGSEQGGIRPVLILQNDVGNMHSETTIIAAMTSLFRNKKHIPTHYIVSSREELTHDSIVLLEQIRTISKSRLKKRIGKLSTDEMNALNKCLFVSVGIKN